jgi:hypothetical protein
MTWLSINISLMLLYFALWVGITATAVAWAFLGHGRYARASEWLLSVSREPAIWPDVVAVVRARDEAAMLPATLPTLLRQDYLGALTVVLVRDCSSGGTAEAAAELGLEPGRHERALRVIAGAPPLPGRAGKAWTMAQGLDAVGLPSAEAAGDHGAGPGYVLFTDADIAWEPGMRCGP